MRKLAVLLGGLLAIGAPFGARALATHATASVDPGPPACANVSAAVDGTPASADQKVCAPESPAAAADVPSLPTLPTPPELPALPQVPVPTLPTLPSVPVPPVQVPPTPPLPVGASTAGLGSGCTFQSSQGTSPTEMSVTLPDGGKIYTSGTDPTTLSGYAGGTGPRGTLEGSGTVSTAGVQGQLGGHSNDAPLDGYVGSSGICVNGNSVP